VKLPAAVESVHRFIAWCCRTYPIGTRCYLMLAFGLLMSPPSDERVALVELLVSYVVATVLVRLGTTLDAVVLDPKDEN
jgi:hypothetical protein